MFQLKSTRLRGLCVIISLPVLWICLLCQHASVSEVCQCVRGLSLKCLSFPGCARGPRCPERPRQDATVPDGSKPTRLYLWCNFYLKWCQCIVLPLMWWPIGCVCCHFNVKSVRMSTNSLVRLGLVVANTVFSPWFGYKYMFTDVIHSILMSENGFVNFSNVV